MRWYPCSHWAREVSIKQYVLAKVAYPQSCGGTDKVCLWLWLEKGLLSWSLRKGFMKGIILDFSLQWEIILNRRIQAKCSKVRVTGPACAEMGPVYAWPWKRTAITLSVTELATPLDEECRLDCGNLKDYVGFMLLFTQSEATWNFEVRRDACKILFHKSYKSWEGFIDH